MQHDSRKKYQKKSNGDPVVGASEVSIEIGVKEMLFEDPKRIRVVENTSRLSLNTVSYNGGNFLTSFQTGHRFMKYVVQEAM